MKDVGGGANMRKLIGLLAPTMVGAAAAYHMLRGTWAVSQFSWGLLALVVAVGGGVVAAATYKPLPSFSHFFMRVSLAAVGVAVTSAVLLAWL